MSNGQADFFRNMLPYARRVSELTGIDPRLVLAQSALETGYGRSAPNFNFFGIKAPRGQGASLMTSEFENGRMVSRSEPFRTYDSPAGSFEDYANLMLRAPRYRPVLEARTLEDQIAAMAGSGYATDPEYGNKLSQIASRINLDDPGLIASDAMAAIGRGPDVSGMTATGRSRPAMNGQPTTPGLLAQGAAPERPRRDIGNILDQLAVGFAGMSLRPNQGIVDLARSRIEERQTQGRRNATADWLESQGFGTFAEGVRQGAISASDALTFARGSQTDPYSTIGKLQADLAAGRISQEQYDLAIQGMAPQGMTIESTPDGGFRLVQGAGAAARPFTEGQSKDLVYATRAEGALQAFEPVADTLTSFGQRVAGVDPTGVVRGAVQTPEFQVAQQAGQEFLQAILRKDTGAAITEQEQRLYGETYLPQPGDGPEVLEQKRAARLRAIEAIKNGMTPLQLLRLEGVGTGDSAGGSQQGGGSEINGVVVGEPIQ